MKFSIRCEWFGWHKPGHTRCRLGVNETAACVRCNRRICRDSQGNWFALRLPEVRDE